MALTATPPPPSQGKGPGNEVASKLRPSAYRSATEMVFTQEMQRVDLELHLELAESPINPAFIYVFTYCKWLRYLIFPQNKRRGALEMARI